MNRGRRTKFLRRFILKYAEIHNEKKVPPDPYYGKGGYFVSFSTYDNSLSTSIIGDNKYEAYKGIVEDMYELHVSNLYRPIKRKDK